MTDCKICGIKSNILFEDEKIIVAFSPEPAIPGHVIVFPKKHFPIIETVPDFIVGDMFKAANKAGVILFESLGAQGTNIVVQNGPPAGQKHTHCLINVLPRFENDNLKIGWTPQPSDEGDLEKIASSLSDETKNVGVFEKEKAKPIEIEGIEEVEKEDYRVKHLRRIP